MSLSSMTAFARAEHVAGWGSLQWELRSVNNRYFDLGLRLPEELRPIEAAVRERVRARVNRGKVDATVKLTIVAEAGATVEVDMAAAEALIDAARAVEAKLGGAHAPLSALDVMRWPGVLRSAEVDAEAVRAAALTSLGAALSDLRETRQREGAKLVAVIADRCEQMVALAARIRARVPEVTAGIRERLTAKLAEVADSVDPQRIEQEIVVFAQRMDCAEELDRLDAHLGEMRRVLGAKGPSGRRLDFLTQELNREANTVASKSADATVTRDAVALKVLVEQIREQVQNIE